MAGQLTISTLSDGINSTSSTNCIQGSAKAWVNFNGTGTPAVRASYNVSSITDNGTGAYTVNLTNAMQDANYSVSGAGGVGNGTGCIVSSPGASANTTTAVYVNTRIVAGTVQPVTDLEYISVQIFR